MEGVSKDPVQRAPGREHFPRFPKGFFAIRIIQLILGVACLALGAYVVIKTSLASGILTIFTVCMFLGAWRTLLMPSRLSLPLSYWFITSLRSLGLQLFTITGQSCLLISFLLSSG